MNYPSLAKLLFDGWIVHMRGVIKLSDAPFADEKIDEIRKCTNNKATHIVFLNHGFGGKGIYYPITSDEELKLAEEDAENSRKITGYGLRISCGATCLDGEIKVDEYAKNIKEITDWDVTLDEREKLFHIKFQFDGDSKEPGYKLIKEVDSYLLAISLKNKIGFEIKAIAWGPQYLAQPISIFFGITESVPKHVSSDEVVRASELTNAEGLSFINKVVGFYSQVTLQSKLIYGFSLFEEILDEKPEHILSRKEQEALIENVLSIPSIANCTYKRASCKTI